MISWTELVRLVQARAGNRGEYCQMHESLQGATYHAEHILSRSRGRDSTLKNLAWACPSCNLHKSDRQSLIDEASAAEVEMFDPRRHTWKDHFQLASYEVIGLTEIGRALILAFHLNSPKRQRIRQAEELFGLFPPTFSPGDDLES